MAEVEGIKLDALDAIAAFAAEDLMLLHDASADAGQRSRKTTLARLFGDALPQLGVRPSAGFGTGQGGVLFEANVGALNPDATPWRLTAQAVEQDGGAQPDNFSWRWGPNQRADGIAGLPAGVQSNWAMVVESSFFTGGIHQGEAYWEVYGGNGAAGTTSARPLFCTWNNADVANTIGISCLAGSFAVAEPGALSSFFTMNRRFGQYGVALEALGEYFTVQGDTAFGAEPAKGQLRFYGYADSTKKMKIGWHGGGGSQFAIVGEAPGGAPSQNPTVLYLSVGGGFTSYFAMRRLSDGAVETDSKTAFGFGITPAASADNNSVHFVGYLNLAEIAAPGDPADGNARLYVDSVTGDVVVKSTFDPGGGAVTKTMVIADWSAAA